MIVAKASGGTGSLSYALDNSNFQPAPEFYNLSAKTYQFFVKDQNGCSPSPISLSLTQPSKLAFRANALSYYINTQLKCFGDSSGQIDFIIRNGVAPYKTRLSLTSPFTDAISFTGLKAGSYSVQVMDANNCLANTSVQLNPPPKLKWNNVSLSSPTCHAGTDAAISLVLSGGTLINNAVYNSNITLPNGTSSKLSGGSISLKNLQAGLYRISTTDAMDCQLDSSIQLFQPEPLTAQLAFNNVVCKGGATGYIFAIASGGSGGYSYGLKHLLSNVQYPFLSAGSGMLANNLPSGNYQIELSDRKGCKPSLPIRQLIAEPNQALKLSIAKNEAAKCFGDANGRAELLATGGWGSYQYALEPNKWQDSRVFELLKAGTRKVYVMDVNTCKDSIELITTQPAPLSLSASQIKDVLCFGGSTGSAVLVAQGGTTPYQFSKGSNGSFQSSNTLNLLSQGQYKTSVKDANACVAYHNLSIAQPTDVVLSLQSLVNATCGKANGTATVLASGGVGGYAYQ